MKDEKTIINDIEFTCPKCGGHRLTKILTNVTCWHDVLECYVSDGEVLVEDEGEMFLEEVGKAWYQCDGCEATFEQHALAAWFGELKEDGQKE